jgi:tetratricopeptide (TPR) repeat protein
VYLHIGNLEAAIGDADAALEWFDRLLREKPTSPLAVPASFNLGMLLMRHGEYGASRLALFRALDLAPGHELAPLALLHIGRSCLEEGDHKRGLALLRRGQAIAVGAECQPRLTLTLAAGLLLADEPRAAHDVLLGHRPQFKDEAVRTTVALLDAMARYRAARVQGPARPEAADLIAALTQHRDANLLGPIETYLCCRAFRELGLWDHIASSCEKALPETQGPMAAALAVMLGTAKVHLQKPAEAARLFQQVAETKEPRWAAEARYHLAALDLADGRAGDCATRCAQIWREQHYADPAGLLRLWGTALDQLGAHAKAARCFAGSPPE